MTQTTKSIDSSMSKLFTDIEASIQSCSFERFCTELNNVKKLPNDIAVTEIDLEEKLKTHEARLNKEKQKLIDIKAAIKDLEADIVKITEEKNLVNDMKLIKLNRKHDMETKIKTLSSIKMNSSDEQKIKIMSTYYEMYKRLTNVKWCFAESSGTELLSGFVFNNRKNQLDWFSVPHNSANHEEAIEKMWSLMSKSSDWSKAIM